MATAKSDAALEIRKLRKKLRQIENLERKSRELTDEEILKITQKAVIRDKLLRLLAEYVEEDEDISVTASTRSESSFSQSVDELTASVNTDISNQDFNFDISKTEVTIVSREDEDENEDIVDVEGVEDGEDKKEFCSSDILADMKGDNNVEIKPEKNRVNKDIIQPVENKTSPVKSPKTEKALPVKSETNSTLKSVTQKWRSSQFEVLELVSHSDLITAVDSDDKILVSARKMPKRKNWKKSVAKKLHHVAQKTNADLDVGHVEHVPPSGPSASAVVGLKVPTDVCSAPSVPLDVGSSPASMITVRAEPGSVLAAEINANDDAQNELSNELTLEISNDLAIEITYDLMREFENELSYECAKESVIEIQNNSVYTAKYSDTRGRPNIELERQAHKSKLIQTCNNCIYCQQLGKNNKHCIFASISQSSPKFSFMSRGRQCTCNALMFLLHFKTGKTISTCILDTVLLNGDELYNRVISSIKDNNQFKSHLLKFEDLPETLQIESCTYKIVKCNPIWGTITDAPNFASAQSLDSAVFDMLEQTGMGLIIAGAVCSALLKYEQMYYFFDSHSHGLDTLPSVEGEAILLIFHEYNDLMSYLYAFFENLGIPFDFQFEILPLLIERFTQNDDFENESISYFTQGDTVSNTVDLSAYFKYQEQMEAHQKQTALCQKGKEKLEQNICVLGKVYKLKPSCSKNACGVRRLSKKMQQRKQYKLKQMQMSRNDPEKKERERQKGLLSKRKAREDLDFKEGERVRSSVSKKKARKNPEFREVDKLRTSRSMKKARQNPEFKEVDKVRTSRSMKEARQNPEFKEVDKVRTSRSMKKARQNPEFKEVDKVRTSRSMKKARQNPEFKEVDKVRTSRSMKKARKNPEFREVDKVRTSRSMKKARQNPEFREIDKVRNLRSMKKARQNPEFREVDKVRNLRSMKKARKSPYYRLKERMQSLTIKRNARENVIHKLKERKRNKNKMRNLRKSAYKLTENTAKNEKVKGSSISECIKAFHNAIKKGFAYVCTCCHQTWSNISVTCLQNCTLNFNSDVVKKCITGYKSVNDQEWICRTCLSALKEDKIPKVSIANLCSFPCKPNELNLHQLEERLIALRIPFMQIRELPRGRQLSIKGNVVNCPVDVQPTVNALPRQVDDNITIPVKLKRKQVYKKCAFVENIRPNVVMKALQWLMENSELYKNSGIQIDSSWIDKSSNEEGEVREFFENTDVLGSNEDNTAQILNTDVLNNETVLAEMKNDKTSTEDGYMSDNFSEVDETERVTGNSDTLLDSVENGTNHVYTFAPGEGQTPLSLYSDPDAEFMAFPTIYCGQKRPTNEERPVKVHYSDIVKSELRSVDRRVANNVPNIFFKLKRLQMKQVTDKVNLAMRRFKTKGKKITAGQLLDESIVNNLVNLDEGYYILRTLRNSPAYMSKRKKDVFAMIRQLGLPTWFVSLSAADTRWKELLKLLAELNNNKIYTEEEIENMTWDEITSLIQNDPVTCSRNFHHRTHQFITIVLKSPHNPVGEMSDHFYRTEFQHRGSPHIHMLIWIKNAPKYNESPIGEVVDFIDKYVSCSEDVAEDMKEHVQLQKHKHSRTCRKKGKAICRFGFPQPPMSRTQILEPLLDDDIDQYRKKYETIQQTLNSMKEGENISFEDFLSKVLKTTEEEYIKCIRSSLNAPKVFLKRNCSEIRINPYMKVVLAAWSANHDIQFVLDPYACAVYIVSYISKSENGMSTLLDQACKEARQGNMDIRKQVRHIGNKFLNAVETSAQEAAYLALQLPLTSASREVIFINTSPQDERTYLLKSKDSLEQLPKESTDIEANNLVKRYAIRPKQLENWCLADYASELQVHFPKDILKNDVDWDKNDDSDIGTENSDEESENKQLLNIKLKNGIVIKQRQKSRILRYVRYSEKTDPENYYREKLLLFLPWRKEESDLLGNFNTFKDHFNSIKSVIMKKLQKYEQFGNELDEAERQAYDNSDEFDLIAPQTEQAASEDLEEGSTPSESYVPFDPQRPIEKRNCDIGIEMGMSSYAVDETLNPSEIPNDQYYTLVRNLNVKQTEFFIHVVHWIKTKTEPLFTFLSGGAGVGKSVLIRALYQSLHRHLCAVEGENPEDIRILLCAPTGKAAFNINGCTVHSAFKIPASQGFTYTPLDSDNLNTLRVKYKDLSVLLIDEVSMVGNGMLNFISERLKQIKNCNKPFGNVSVILIGDLFQLKPVFDRWVFENLVAQYGALATNLWTDHFQMYELTEIMRQKDDLNFANLLNRLREGNHTDDDISELEKCIVDRNSLQHNCPTPHLYTTRLAAHSWNSAVFNITGAQKVIINSVDDVKSQDTKTVKMQILDKIPQDSTKTSGLLSCLPVAVDLKYDLTANVDTSDGLTNGATCVLKMIDYRQENTSRPSILWVQFEDDKIGFNWRKTYIHLYNNGINNDWTPIFDINRTFPIYRKQVTRIQFPLCPSAAKTIHKAQGSTLDEVYVDMTMSRSVPHIHYVALSRARSISGLHIIELAENKILVDRKVLDEMERLRAQPYSLCYTPIYNIEPESFTVAFNNVRSLNLHFEDIKCNKNIKSADIVAFAETRLRPTENSKNFIVDGFQLIRNDDESVTSGNRPFYGTAAYVSDKVYDSVRNHHKIRSKNCECLKFDLMVGHCNLQVIVIYSHPNCTQRNFKKFVLEQVMPVTDLQQNLVLVGDFNFDIYSGKNVQFLNFVNTTFSVKQIVTGITTKYDSALDLIFTNISHTHTDIIECYWSDHKLVYAAFKKG